MKKKRKKKNRGHGNQHTPYTEHSPVINGEGFLILTGRLDNLDSRLEVKFEQVFNNQAVMTDRINKRETEIEDLKKETHETQNQTQQRLTHLESAQRTERWFIGIGLTVVLVVATVISLFT